MGNSEAVMVLGSCTGSGEYDWMRAGANAVGKTLQSVAFEGPGARDRG